MKTRSIVAIALLTLVTFAFSRESARAQHPTYLILKAHAVSTGHRGHGQLPYPGVGAGVATPTYAYGWFGAPPRKHWSRHFGYYRNYTQWTRR